MALTGLFSIGNIQWSAIKPSTGEWLQTGTWANKSIYPDLWNKFVAKGLGQEANDGLIHPANPGLSEPGEVEQPVTITFSANGWGYAIGSITEISPTTTIMIKYPVIDTNNAFVTWYVVEMKKLPGQPIQTAEYPITLPASVVQTSTNDWVNNPAPGMYPMQMRLLKFAEQGDEWVASIPCKATKNSNHTIICYNPSTHATRVVYFPNIPPFSFSPVTPNKSKCGTFIESFQSVGNYTYMITTSAAPHVIDSGVGTPPPWDEERCRVVVRRRLGQLPLSTTLSDWEVVYTTPPNTVGWYGGTMLVWASNCVENATVIGGHLYVAEVATVEVSNPAGSYYLNENTTRLVSVTGGPTIPLHTSAVHVPTNDTYGWTSTEASVKYTTFINSIVKTQTGALISTYWSMYTNSPMNKYDPTTSTWGIIASNPSIQGIMRRRLVVIGGTIYIGDSTTNKIYTSSDDGNTWITHTIPEFTNQGGVDIIPVGGVPHVVSVGSAPGGASGSANAWIMSPNMQSLIGYGIRATSMPSSGGSGDNADAYFYIPKSNTAPLVYQTSGNVTPTPSITTPFTHHTPPWGGNYSAVYTRYFNGGTIEELQVDQNNKITIYPCVAFSIEGLNTYGVEEYVPCILYRWSGDTSWNNIQFPQYLHQTLWLEPLLHKVSSTQIRIYTVNASQIFTSAILTLNPVTKSISVGSSTNTTIDGVDVNSLTHTLNSIVTLPSGTALLAYTTSTAVKVATSTNGGLSWTTVGTIDISGTGLGHQWTDLSQPIQCCKLFLLDNAVVIAMDSQSGTAPPMYRFAYASLSSLGTWSYCDTGVPNSRGDGVRHISSTPTSYTMYPGSLIQGNILREEYVTHTRPIWAISIDKTNLSTIGMGTLTTLPPYTWGQVVRVESTSVGEVAWVAITTEELMNKPPLPIDLYLNESSRYASTIRMDVFFRPFTATNLSDWQLISTIDTTQQFEYIVGEVVKSNDKYSLMAIGDQHGLWNYSPEIKQVTVTDIVVPTIKQLEWIRAS